MLHCHVWSQPGLPRYIHAIGQSTCFKPAINSITSRRELINKSYWPHLPIKVLGFEFEFIVNILQPPLSTSGLTTSSSLEYWTKAVPFGRPSLPRGRRMRTISPQTIKAFLPGRKNTREKKNRLARAYFFATSTCISRHRDWYRCRSSFFRHRLRLPGQALHPRFEKYLPFRNRRGRS